MTPGSCGRIHTDLSGGELTPLGRWHLGFGGLLQCFARERKTFHVRDVRVCVFQSSI